MINKKQILTAFIFFVLGATTIYSFNKPKLITPTENDKKQTTASNPLAFITGVKTTKGIIYILIDQDNVYFHPFEDMGAIYKVIDIKKEDYPKLFEQGIANYSALQADEFIDPQTKETLIELSNSQPDHGGYSSTYVLLVNPFTGSIKEGQDDYSRRKSSSGQSDLSYKIEQIKKQGYTTYDTSTYNSIYPLNVFIGIATGSADGYNQKAFFFYGDQYLGTDTIDPSTIIKLASRDDKTITLKYILYNSSDVLANPTGGFATVRYQWDGSKLNPLDPIPTSDWSVDGHR